MAIVLERAPSPHATALRLEAYGVTPREREVAAMLAQGLSNGEIAARLVLSPFTVHDDYLPQIVRPAPLTPRVPSPTRSRDRDLVCDS